MRALAEFAMRGWFQAAVLAAGTGMVGASMPFLFPLVWVAGAAVALPTLRNGIYAGLKVLAVAAAITALTGQLVAGNPLMALLLAAGAWGPALLLAAVLRSTVSLPVTLLIAGLLGTVPVFGAYLALGDPVVWLQEVLQPFAAELTESGAMTAAAADQMIAVLARSLTGGVALMVALWAIASILIARYWQAALYNPGGFKSEFLSLRMGRIATLGIALLTAGGMFSGLTLIEDISRPLAVVFAFQAAAVAHQAVDLERMHKGFLTAMYVAVALLTTPLLHLMVIFGMVDNWLDVRARLSATRA